MLFLGCWEPRHPSLMDQLLLQASLGKRAYLSQRVGRSIASRASALSRAYLTCLDIKPLNAQQTPRVKQDPFRVRAAPQGVNFPFSPWISQVQTQLLQQTGPSGWQLTPVEPSFSLGGGQSRWRDPASCSHSPALSPPGDVRAHKTEAEPHTSA